MSGARDIDNRLLDMPQWKLADELGVSEYCKTCVDVTTKGDCPNNRYPEPRHFSYIAGEVRRHTEVMTLGVTKNGSPRHPSRLPYSTDLVAWDAAIAATRVKR